MLPEDLDDCIPRELGQYAALAVIEEISILADDIVAFAAPTAAFGCPLLFQSTVTCACEEALEGAVVHPPVDPTSRSEPPERLFRRQSAIWHTRVVEQSNDKSHRLLRHISTQVQRPLL